MFEWLENEGQMIASQGASIEAAVEQANEEKAKAAEFLPAAQTAVLKTVFRNDQQFLGRLRYEHLDLIHAQMTGVLTVVFGDRQSVNQHMLIDEKPVLPNAAIRFERAEKVIWELLHNGNVKNLFNGKQPSPAQDVPIRLLKALIQQEMARRPDFVEGLRNQLLQLIYVSDRKYEQGRETDEGEETATPPLGEVLRALYGGAVLSEAQYYALGLHFGTIRLSREEPVGDEPEARERRRKRHMAMSRDALESGLAIIRTRFQAKLKLSRLALQGVRPPEHLSHRLMLLALGNEADVRRPVPRQALPRMLAKELPAAVQPPTDDEIGEGLSKGLVWAFDIAVQ